jgi:hypothetical protein
MKPSLATLTIFFLLAVSLSGVVIFQNYEIQRQRLLIREMTHNPACMVGTPRTFDGDKYIPVPNGSIPKIQEN